MRLIKRMAKLIEQDMRMKRKAFNWHINSPYESGKSLYEWADRKEYIDDAQKYINQISEENKNNVFDGSLKDALNEYIDSIGVDEGHLYEYETTPSSVSLYLFVDNISEDSYTKKTNPIIGSLGELLSSEYESEKWDINEKIFFTWKEVDGGYQFEAEIK